LSKGFQSPISNFEQRFSEPDFNFLTKVFGARFLQIWLQNHQNLTKKQFWSFKIAILNFSFKKSLIFSRSTPIWFDTVYWNFPHAGCVEEKFTKFSGEQRDARENLWIQPYFGRILSKIVFQMQNWALPKFQILVYETEIRILKSISRLEFKINLHKFDLHIPFESYLET